MLRGIVILSVVVIVFGAVEADCKDPMPITQENLELYIDTVRNRNISILESSQHEFLIVDAGISLFDAMEKIGYDYEATVVKTIRMARRMHRSGKYDAVVYDAWQIFAIGAALSRTVLYDEELISDETKELLDEVAAKVGL